MYRDRRGCVKWNAQDKNGSSCGYKNQTMSTTDPNRQCIDDRRDNGQASSLHTNSDLHHIDVLAL